MSTPELSRFILAQLLLAPTLTMLLLTRARARCKASHPHARQPDLNRPTGNRFGARLETRDRAKNNGVQLR